MYNSVIGPNDYGPNDSALIFGLEFNDTKTEILSDKYTTLLGDQINSLGTNALKKIEYNTRKLINKLRRLAYSGVFRYSLKINHLLSAVVLYILPIIE